MEFLKENIITYNIIIKDLGWLIILFLSYLFYYIASYIKNRKKYNQ